MRQSRVPITHYAIVLTAWLVLSLAQAQEAPVKPAAGAIEQRSERGPVSALVRLEPEHVRIGDPVTLTIEVVAEPGVELLMPVFGASLERFAILEFVPREHINDAGQTVSTQVYRLQALASGEHTIPPITIEFVDRRPGQRPAPDDEDAFELLTERLPFSVESVLPVDAGSNMKPPLGPLDALVAPSERRWPWLLGGSIASIVGLGMLLVVLMRHRRRGVQRSAYEIALERLQSLEIRPRPDADAMDGFFVELSDLVRRYLEDRFGLHAPELTTEEFLDVAASSPDLTKEHRSFLQSFLRIADRVKFARFVPNSSDVESALSAVRNFLLQTSQAALPPASGTGSSALNQGASRA